MKETKPVKSNYRYTIKEDSNIDNVFPVLSEVEENKPLRPFLEETVGKTKDYYNMKDSENDQMNSLVYYENTYMPNTGIIYSLFRLVSLFPRLPSCQSSCSVAPTDPRSVVAACAVIAGCTYIVAARSSPPPSVRHRVAAIGSCRC